MHNEFILFVMLLFLSQPCVAQSLDAKTDGKQAVMVVDKSGNSVDNASVLLLNSADSTFILGGTTDNSGLFSAECRQREVIACVSCIGYRTVFHNCESNRTDTIRLQEDNIVLGGVVIKAHRPTYKISHGNMSADISGTVYEKLGTAGDVLAQLPLITENGDNIEISGHGTPAIYINGRKINDVKELAQLKSEQIKSVDVLLNPGSLYGNDVQSVIRINTKRPVGEGLGGDVYLYARQRREFSHYEELNLNYRHKGLDLFATVDFMRNQYRQNQTGGTSFTYGNSPVEIKTDGKIKGRANYFEAISGVNYQLTDKQSLGIRYSYNRDFNGHTTASDINDYSDGTASSRFNTFSLRLDDGYKHYLSAYYQAQLGSGGSINVDGSLLANKSFMNEKETEDRDNAASEVNSTSASKASLYAVKAWAALPLWQGSISVGTEDILTDNRQQYDMLDKDVAQYLPSSSNKVRQTSLAAFVSYDRTWKHLSAQAGLRYENVDFNYYQDGTKSPGQSRRYSNLFPNGSLTFAKNSFSASLSYRTVVSRPSYWDLRSNISYNSSYFYEGGNPALQPTMSHQTELLLRYRDFVLNAAYSYIKDDQIVHIAHYKDQPVVLFSPINADRRRYSASLSYSPTIQIWHPSWLVGIIAQDFSYASRKYNHPQLEYSWKNIVNIPNGWTVVLNMRGKSAGNWQAEYSYSWFTMECYVKKALHNWEISLGGTGLFKKDREKWHLDMDDITTSKNNDVDRYGIYARILYRFNPAKSKYKGTGAGSSEQNRF